MEIKDFKNGLVKYYGEHQSKHVTDSTLKYVESNFEKGHYRGLMQEIMKSHPFNYGFPDVAAIESAHDKFFKKYGKTLRKSRPPGEAWQTSIALPTEEERKEAEPMRKDWKKLIGKLSDKATDRVSCSTCKHLGPTKTGICKKCVNFSEYEVKK